jgi:hydrogenase maturation protease
VNFERVQEIADAVLYEGYMLYPYRPSSVKNQQRFNFGVLCPPAYCQMHPGSESSFLQSECLLKLTPATRITVKVRFLHMVLRRVCSYDANGVAKDEERLGASGRQPQPWQEAEERTFSCSDIDPASLSREYSVPFSFLAGTSCEELRDEQGGQSGDVLREWQGVGGLLRMHAQSCRDDVIRLRLRLENSTSHLTDEALQSRDAALLYSMISAHAIVGAENGEFVSLLDPPREFEELAHACENTGVWPVLAGDDATTILASPIILYDYPQIAPESAANLFDATEIDEILSLRILTLTDAEKDEIRRSDDRARQLLERTENIPDEQFMKLHGVLRGMTVLKEAKS